ncbi:MAG: hypothetical protein LAT80_11780 [Balneolaceae bacterium]|nr:hypothetical protein [Balneolaceae bacterium]
MISIYTYIFISLFFTNPFNYCVAGDNSVHTIIDGSLGLIVPVVEVVDNEDIISETTLWIERDRSTVTFQTQIVNDPEPVQFQTNLPALSLYPDSDHSDLPYDMLERVVDFTLSVTNTDLNYRSETLLKPISNRSRLSGDEIEALLKGYEVPLTFNLDQVTNAISELGEADKSSLRDEGLLKSNNEPAWSLKNVSTIEVDIPVGEHEISISFPLFPSNSYSTTTDDLKQRFCTTDNDSYAFMMISQHNGGLVPFSYHTLNLDKYENLTQLQLVTGRVEGTASCIEGEREFEGMDITIINPVAKSGREASVMFFSP